MVNFGSLAAEIGPVVRGTPVNFNGFRVLAVLLHGTPVVGVSQILQPYAALNTGRHLYSAGLPSRWTLAYNLVLGRPFVKRFALLSDLSCPVLSVCL